MYLKAITFDLWGTLLNIRNYAEIRLPEIKRVLFSCGFNLTDEAIYEAYMSGFRHSSKVISSEGLRHVETVEIVEKVLESVGCDSKIAREELVAIYEHAALLEPPSLKEGAYEALSYVNDHYKVGLVSVTGVTPGRVIREILEAYGVLEYFDVLTFSDEVKVVKPHTGIFQSCLRDMGVEAAQAVHVGDSFKGDVVGAIDTGMQVIWVRDREQVQVPGYIPYAVISSLLELSNVLRCN